MARSTKASISKAERNRILGQTNEYIEGSVELLPNSDYSAREAYFFSGFESMFNGIYYFKSVSHKFDSEGYSVSADVALMETGAVDTAKKTTSTASTGSKPAAASGGTSSGSTSSVSSGSVSINGATGKVTVSKK